MNKRILIKHAFDILLDKTSDRLMKPMCFNIHKKTSAKLQNDGYYLIIKNDLLIHKFGLFFILINVAIL